ncbi:thioesterase family protein [Mycobacterium paraintracellulare]|uniref:thioesterase family protein n=1 Tax=Mycobacterium paraintracellulare TaxID=1138383 RepID=UPI001EED29B0|nr:thioesterase family protein [Mycobacterium paraintracellulare]WVL48046.1 thioesterase family protein [Mycobacterium paraintracellulare]
MEDSSPKPTRAAPTCFFVTDGKDYIPTRLTRGPWGPSISGNYVGGLLGRAVEQEVDDADLQPARLTVDLLRPVALQPLQVHSSVVRDGRRLRLVDAVMTQSDVMVARASALFLRRSDHAVDTVWTSPVTMPAVPVEPEVLADDVPMVLHSYGRDPVAGSPGVGVREWQHHGQKFAWLRETKLLVDDEPLSPFTRAIMAGDVTSSLTHWGTEGLEFINADYTIALSRLPVGVYIGLASMTHYSHAGVATGVATLFDEKGPIGSGMATALANPGFTPPPSIVSS